MRVTEKMQPPQSVWVSSPNTQVKPQTIRLEGYDSIAFSGARRSQPTLHRKLAPLLASVLLPFSTLVAGITPQSTQVVQSLGTNNFNFENDEQDAAALNSLANVKESDAVPFAIQTLNEGTASISKLRMAVKLLSKVGSDPQTPDSQKAAFSKVILPYVLNVVVDMEDKDKYRNPSREKTSQFMSDSDAKLLVEQNPEYVIKDLRMQAAKALGPTTDAEMRKKLAAAVQDVSTPVDARILWLETLHASPLEPDIDKQLMDYLDQLDPKKEVKLYAAFLNVLLPNHAKELLPQVEKVLSDPDSDATESKAADIVDDDSDTDAVTRGKQAKNTRGKSIADPKMFGFSIGFDVDSKPPASPTQKTLIDMLLQQKSPDVLPLLTTQMAIVPRYFQSQFGDDQNNFFNFMAALPDSKKEELLDLTDPAKVQRIVKKVLADNKKQAVSIQDAFKKVMAQLGTKNPIKDDDKVDVDMLTANARDLHRLALTWTVALQMPKASPIFRKVIADPTQDEASRHLAIVGSAMLKDSDALGGLLQLAANDTEDNDMRFDALSAMNDILTPPVAKGLTTDSDQISDLSRYVNVYQAHPDKLTHSFYKARLFEKVRQVQKTMALNHANPGQIENAVDHILTRELAVIPGLGDKLNTLAAQIPNYTQLQHRLVQYVTQNRNADGILRVAMLKTLGSIRNRDVVPSLEELIREPLVRTQIADIQTCNDVLNFPGYTKFKVELLTRLAAIQALGTTGNIDAKHTDLLNKAIHSDALYVHSYGIHALAELGKATQNGDETVQAQRQSLRQNLLKRMEKLHVADDDYTKLFLYDYALAVDALGGTDEMIAQLADPKVSPVIKREMANAMLFNGHSDRPEVSQYKVRNMLGLDRLPKGIDGHGREVAVIDRAYLNTDMKGLEGKVTYPEWGRIHDATMNSSTHSQSVATAIVDVAPGVDRIWTYCDIDNNPNATPDTPLEERDGMVRALADIVSRKLNNQSKVVAANISLGTSAAALYGDETFVKDYCQKLAGYFLAGSRAGITFFISAGNQQGDILQHHLIGTLNSLGFSKQGGKIVQNNGVLLIGASDTRGTDDVTQHQVASFSSTGDPFNQTSPNGLMPGTDLPLWSRQPNGEVRLSSEDGTSFSSPLSAGLALLMDQAYSENHDGKSLSSEKLAAILAATATPLTDVPQYQEGPGEFNPVKAVEAAAAEKN